jgi:hypothetical protein
VHPAVDRETPEAVVVEQNRAVVSLGGWLVDAARAASHTERLLQILTLPDSALTYPVELLLNDGGGQWVRREGRGFCDGFTGAPLGWTGTRFAPVEGPVPPVAATTLADGGLVLQVTTLHASTAELEVGAVGAAPFAALTGSGPAGWGVNEPATQPWSPREVTAACRERAPDPTALVVVGGEPGRRAVGRLCVSRVDTGVLEELRLSGPAASAVAQTALDDLAAALVELTPAPRSMVVTVHPTRVGGLRPPWPSPPALPYAVLIGPAEVARRGTEHARSAPAGQVRLLGGACWCRLIGDSPYEQLAAVLEHFG